MRNYAGLLNLSEEDSIFLWMERIYLVGKGSQALQQTGQGGV